MDYLHMQNSTLLNNPPNCIGVPVTLTAVDPLTATLLQPRHNHKQLPGQLRIPMDPNDGRIVHLFTLLSQEATHTYESYGETAATVAATTISNCNRQQPSPTPTPTTTTALHQASAQATSKCTSSIAAVVIVIAIAVVGHITAQKKAISEKTINNPLPFFFFCC